MAFFDSIFLKSAVLIQGLIHNHPFFDGNKRAAYDSAVILLRLNGYRLLSHISDEEQADFVVGVANKEHDLEVIVRRLDRHFIRI